MRRTAWDAFDASSTNVVLIDVTATPIGGVASESSMVAAVAQRFSPDEGRVSIYRHDPNDSDPINVDHYRVYLDLASSPRLGEMITAASTSHNENMQNYLHQHVHLVKEDRGADHWLPELPSSVRIVLERLRST